MTPQDSDYKEILSVLREIFPKATVLATLRIQETTVDGNIVDEPFYWVMKSINVSDNESDIVNSVWKKLNQHLEVKREDGVLPALVSYCAEKLSRSAYELLMDKLAEDADEITSEAVANVCMILLLRSEENPSLTGRAYYTVSRIMEWFGEVGTLKIQEAFNEILPYCLTINSILGLISVLGPQIDLFHDANRMSKALGFQNDNFFFENSSMDFSVIDRYVRRNMPPEVHESLCDSFSEQIAKFLDWGGEATDDDQFKRLLILNMLHLRLESRKWPSTMVDYLPVEQSAAMVRAANRFQDINQMSITLSEFKEVFLQKLIYPIMLQINPHWGYQELIEDDLYIGTLANEAVSLFFNSPAQVIQQAKYWQDRAHYLATKTSDLVQDEFNWAVLPGVKTSTGLRFVPLRGVDELQEEGRVLKHCVGIYGPACSRGNSFILSLRVRAEHQLGHLDIYDGGRIGTIEVNFDKANEEWVCKQIRGYEDGKLPQHVCDLVEGYVTYLNDNPEKIDHDAIEKSVAASRLRDKDIPMWSSIGFDWRDQARCAAVFDTLKTVLLPDRRHSLNWHSFRGIVLSALGDAGQMLTNAADVSP